MKRKKDKEVLCRICLTPITHVKGAQGKYTELELQQREHIECANKVRAILLEFGVEAIFDPSEKPPTFEFAALFAGVLELFKDKIEETEVVREYRRRRVACEEKLEVEFPGFIARLKAEQEELTRQK